MRLARITGTVTATVKAPGLTGRSLMLIDVVDSDQKVLQPATVAVDTCGSGPGDLVLIAEGSAARLLPDTSGLCIDVAIIAVIDRVDTAGSAT